MIQRIANMVRDSIRPDATMFVHYKAEKTENVQIIKVSVGRGTARPYYWGEKGLQPAGVYVRQGTSAAPATDTVIRQMIRETDGSAYEDMRSLNQELRFSYAEAAFERQHLELKHPQMKTLSILSAEDVYTNLGLLLSDQCPHIIKAAVFSGTDQTEFRNRREFSGSLLKQVDEAYAFLDMLNETSADFDGLRRIDHRAYPEAALREALLNAVIHRDYSYSAGTLISIYSDRIEIVSVGGLVAGFSLDDVMMGISICRNPKLANIFYRLDLIEAYGTGLQKILRSYSGLSPEKLLHTTDMVFKVTLPRRGTAAQADRRHDRSYDRQILSYLSSAAAISRTEAEQLTGLSMSSAARLLRRMVESGILESVGKGKNTRYRLHRS